MAEINLVQEKLQQATLVGSESKKEAAASIAGGGSDPEEAGKARNILVDICSDWIFPVALRTVVELDVAHILANHASTYDMASMTAEEILRYMPDATCPSPLNLERLLRMLVSKGIFAEHVVMNEVAHGDHTITRVVRRFSLTWLSRYLVPGTPGTLRYWALLTTLSPEFAAALEFLGDAVLKSEEPFIKAHGKNYFDWTKSHPTIRKNFKDAFISSSIHFIPLFLSEYHGFESVHKLVDVGGSSGMMLAGIVEKHPHIQAINFDLPEVVANNPSLPGVEHVGGDMFEKVPGGCDAIFMKSILHDWSDEHCLKILKNCYAALPSQVGKVIIMEQLMPVETPLEATDGIRTTCGAPLRTDMLMLIHCEGGRERSAVEYDGLAKQAGFTSFRVVSRVGDSMYSIMEAHK